LSLFLPSSEISSQVTNGLFTVTGVGFIPWRVRDAYRISAIWRLQHIDRKLRKKRGLEAGVDKNQAPDPEWDEDFVQVCRAVSSLGSRETAIAVVAGRGMVIRIFH
jgi:hypothetical protein